MLVLQRTIFFSNAIKRRTISSTCMFNTLPNEKPSVLKKSVFFDPEKLLDDSNSSIRSFINMEKLIHMKSFYHTPSATKCTYNFVIDEGVAKDIVNNIVTNNEQKNGIIVEGNPGLGLITINLINSSDSHVLVFEKSEMEDIVLTQLIAHHPQRITKKVGNMNLTTESMLLKSLEFCQGHGAGITIVGVTTSYYFLRALVMNFIRHNLWQTSINIFMVVSTSMLNSLSLDKATASFKPCTACLFHLLFTVEKIETYPREAFLPFSKQNPEDMNLIKISINENALKNFTKEELKELFIFLKVLAPKLSSFIIPTLEKWLPNCGLYLISKGVAMTTQVSDLSHEEAICLYHIFKNIEGYSEFKKLTSHFVSELTA